MAALDLTGVRQYPYVTSTTTPGTSNTCKVILFPQNVSLQVTLHNRDKATKGLAYSFDQTLTDGGAAPSTYFSVSDPVHIKCSQNRISGYASVTQVAIFSVAHTNVNCGILIEEDGI